MNLPIEAFSESVAVLGRTGSGKSYAAKGQIEKALDRGERVCIIDPTGVWYGLRSSSNGARAGYPVAIFGGLHADVEIIEASAVPLAKLIALRNLPVIVDVSEMGMNERTRFMTHFLEALYRANRKPLTLVVDEADLFAPQRPMPDQTVMLNRMEQIVRRGRVRGFVPWLITQRPAELHKSVLSQASTLIAMRLTSPQDRAAIGAWIEGQADRAIGKDVLAALPKLPPGTGYLWCPAADFLERIAFPKIKTFDSGRTPEHGESIEPPAKLSDVNLSGVREALVTSAAKAAGLPAKASRASLAEPLLGSVPVIAQKLLFEMDRLGVTKKQLADHFGIRQPSVHDWLAHGRIAKHHLTRLAEWSGRTVTWWVDNEVLPGMSGDNRDAREVDRARIAELEAELAAANSTIETLKATTDHAIASAKEAAATAKKATDVIGAVIRAVETGARLDLPAPVVSQAKAAPRTVPPPSPPKRVEPTQADNAAAKAAGVGTAELRVINALCWWKEARISTPSRHQVAFVAKYTVNGHFNNTVGSLKAKGLVTYPGDGTIELTVAGEAHGSVGEEVSRRALIEKVVSVLKGEPMKRVFLAVVAHTGQQSREDLAASCGYTVNGHFNNIVGALNGVGVIAYPARGMVALSDMFEGIE